MAKSKTEQLLKSAQEKLDLQDKCKTDKLFLSQQLGYDFQEDVHSDLFANYLQITPGKNLFEQSTKKDRMVLWSRGTYKTTSIVVEIIQLILNFPDIRILLMQDTVKNAMVLLDEVRKHFDGTYHKSNLSEIFPEFCQLDKKLGTKHSFTTPARTANRKEATVTVASPRSSKTGMHYEAGFFDDLVTAENYESPEQLQKTISDFSLYVPLIDPGGYRYVTGTRYTFGDLYEHIIRQDAESHSWQISIRGCWTVNADGTKTLLFPQRILAGGRPIGHTLEFLLAKQADDPAMFSAQYLNQPIATDAQLFTEELLMSRVKSSAEENFPSLGFKTLFVDVASSGANDDSVIMCGQQDPVGNIYVTDGVGGTWQTPNLVEMVIAKCLEHRPLKILIEKSGAGIVFANYVKSEGRHLGLNIPIDFIKVNNQKDAKHIRISIAAGKLKQGKLFFLAGLPCWKNLFNQCITYTRNRHDDYPDTVALMVQHYQDNNATTPVVHSLAHYLMQQPALPAFTQDNPISSHGGSCGSDFGC